MSVFQIQTPDQMDSATRELIQREMTEKSDNIAVLIEDFNDMLEDFTVADVNRGNTQFVKEKLDNIANARNKTRKAIREYQGLYGAIGDQEGRLAGVITSMNERVRSHANLIWERVAELDSLRVPQPGTGERHSRRT